MVFIDHIDFTNFYFTLQTNYYRNFFKKLIPPKTNHATIEERPNRCLDQSPEKSRTRREKRQNPIDQRRYAQWAKVRKKPENNMKREKYSIFYKLSEESSVLFDFFMSI